MLFYTLSAFSLATFGLFINGESTLPITICKRDSVDYSACLKSFLEETWPQFISGEIHAEVTLSNTTVIGLSKTRFYDIRTQFLDDEFRLEVDIQVPRLFLEGVVKVNGSLGVFRIADNGQFNLTADEVKGTWDLTGPIVNDIWIVEHFRIFPSVKKLKVYFNLFQGNKELNDLAIIFVNEFWPPLYRGMLPVAANLWDPSLVNLVNNIFSKVPFSKIFP